MIKFSGVDMVYPGGTTALKDINLHIKKGEFVFIIGHSGAGKSTLIKMLLREERPVAGELTVNGYDLKKITEKEIPYLRRTLGVVFQDFRLIPTLNAFDNIAFAMRVTSVDEAEVKKRVPVIMNLVGLGDKAASYPHELSGGEQQRVALARALVHNPTIIIADEPTGNIDPDLSIEIMELLSAINKVGTTVVVVSHEQDLARRFNKRMITIEKGQVVYDTGAEVVRTKRDETQNPEAEQLGRISSEQAASFIAEAEDIETAFEDGSVELSFEPEQVAQSGRDGEQSGLN